MVTLVVYGSSEEYRSNFSLRAAIFLFSIDDSFAEHWFLYTFSHNFVSTAVI